MPELPEVETIRRGLEKLAIKKTIRKVYVLCEKSLRGDVSHVEGQEIVEYDRRGKALLVRLSNGYTMMYILNLRMEQIYISMINVNLDLWQF